MTRWGLAGAAVIATACGLSVTGAPLPGGTGDGGAAVVEPLPPSPPSPSPDASPDPSLDGAVALDAAPPGTRWCATQPAHQLCLDFDDGDLGPMKLINQGSAKCVVSGLAFDCTTESAGSKPYGVAKEWKPKPKTIDLALDLDVTGTGYSQVAGITTQDPYYELLFSPNGGDLDYIEYSAGASTSQKLADAAGRHRVRLQVNFTTNHVTVSEGGNVKYDADIKASLAGTTGARVFLGLYDTDRARSATIDNVTVDWTE